MSEGACVLPPAVTAGVCTDGRQEGHTVYCFRLRGVPAVTDGLGPVFHSVSQSLQMHTVRSLAATSNLILISLDQKQGFHNISIKVPDIGHPSTEVRSELAKNNGFAKCKCLRFFAQVNLKTQQHKI